MLGWLFGKGYEARELNRDAPVIIGLVVREYREALVREIATLTRDERAAVGRVLESVPARRAEVRRELERKHREARRQFRTGPLTAYTLVLIDLRAEAIGEAGAPAREAIEAFIEAWADA